MQSWLVNWQLSSVDYQPRNGMNGRTAGWQNWGEGSTQFVLSSLSVWCLNLFCCCQLNQRIHTFNSCWSAIQTGYSTLILLDKFSCKRPLVGMGLATFIMASNVNPMFPNSVMFLSSFSWHGIYVFSDDCIGWINPNNALQLYSHCKLNPGMYRNTFPALVWVFV